MIQYRPEYQLKQADMAARLGPISHWERGLSAPSVVNLFRLALIYGVRPEELYPDLFDTQKKFDSRMVGDQSGQKVEPEKTLQNKLHKIREKVGISTKCVLRGKSSSRSYYSK